MSERPVRALPRSSGKPPSNAPATHIAIETPHGPVGEALLARGFAVYAINPKQLDRFRDRYSMAGAKDDSRDCLVLGSALRSDPNAFRRLSPDEPLLVELREWSRLAEGLGVERLALVNRLREQPSSHPCRAWEEWSSPPCSPKPARR